MRSYRYILFVISVLFSITPLYAQDSWSVVHEDVTVFHRDMTCLSDEHCIVVGAITNPNNNFENGAYIGISDDGGKTWRQAQYDLPMKIEDVSNVSILSVLTTDASHVFAVGAGGVILRSVDGGETWSTTSNVKNWIYHFLSFSSNMVGITGSRFGGVMLKTIDGGETWQDISIASKPIVQQAVCLSVDTLLALTGDVNSTTSMHGFMRSTDGGNTWQQEDFYVKDYDGAPPQDIRISSMSFVTDQEGYIAGTKKASVYSAVVMKTVDQGKTWTVVLDTTVAESTTFGVEKIHIIGRDTLVVICTDGKQFSTIDAGMTWQILAPSPLGNQPFYRASAFSSLQAGYIADGLHRVHRYALTTSIVDGNESHITDLPSVALRTVFPNPVSRSTANVQVYVRSTEQMRQCSLKIYNIYGQEVKDVSTSLAALASSPVATISFETEGLQNGVYFLRISSGAESYTQGFVVAR